MTKLIRDGRLALTVGAAPEDRMLRDGHSAMALVPAVRGAEFADRPAAASGGSTAAVDTAYVQPAASPAGGANNTSTPSSVSNFFTLLGTAFNNAMAQYGQAQITNA